MQPGDAIARGPKRPGLALSSTAIPWRSHRWWPGPHARGALTVGRRSVVVGSTSALRFSTFLLLSSPASGPCQAPASVRPGPPAAHSPAFIYYSWGWGGWAASCPVGEESSRARSSVLSWLAAGAQCRWLVLGGAAGGREGGPSWGPWGAGVGGEDPTKAAGAAARRGRGHAPGGRPHSALAPPSSTSFAADRKSVV